MQSVGGVDRAARRRQDALLDHVPCAVPALLPRLEHEHHVPGEAFAPVGEQPGGADETGGVQVVAAGVHGAVDPGGELRAGALGDRQTVHVPAQQDDGAAGLGSAAAQDRRHGGQ